MPKGVERPFLIQTSALKSRRHAALLMRPVPTASIASPHQRFVRASLATNGFEEADRLRCRMTVRGRRPNTRNRAPEGLSGARSIGSKRGPGVNEPRAVNRPPAKYVASGLNFATKAEITFAGLPISARRSSGLYTIELTRQRIRRERPRRPRLTMRMLDPASGGGASAIATSSSDWRRGDVRADGAGA
jgi:hypothetical protein